MGRVTVLFFLICIVNVFLVGCASHGVIINEKQVEQFQRGKTRESDVIAVLGKPTSVTTYNGQRTLGYTGAQAQARPESFIPFVGPFVGGMDVKSSHLILQFGSDGTLSNVVSSHSATGSGRGFAAGSPIETDRDQPRKPEKPDQQSAP